ncbi:MAG: (4Fe-4S)-binding protein [Euryarchaeota archaeon]|nr:(4Fe-4S)-binding protein [Euryarchaeota archaeon]
MRIAVASGKGGTGKTTVAVNLALSLGECALLDCDVEEPNCALFLDASLEKVEDVVMKVPCFDLDTCTYCGKCAHFCRYHAIAVVAPDRLLFFPELCHSCGGCAIICPEGAVSERDRTIGEISQARIGRIRFLQGKLRVGEPMASPVIKRLKATPRGDGIAILDSPPGTACPVIETIRGSDFAILVTEPTPFGLHDLKLAVAVVRRLRIPFGVVVNRDGIGDDRVDSYCRESKIPVLMRIPEMREIAELYSRGIPFSNSMTRFREDFTSVIEGIREQVDRRRI